MEEGILIPEADPHHRHAGRDEAPGGGVSQVCVPPVLGSTVERMYMYSYCNAVVHQYPYIHFFSPVTKLMKMGKMCRYMVIL